MKEYLISIITNEYLISIIIGVISGVIASYVFLFIILKIFRPKIKISKWIVKETEDNSPKYVFKFINKTNSKIFDVKVELKAFEPFGDVNGQNLRTRKIPLKQDYMKFIDKEDINDSYNKHAIRVVTTEDIESVLNNPPAFLELVITARHEKSGFVGIFSNKYHSNDNIKSTNFKSGNDLDVI